MHLWAIFSWKAIKEGGLEFFEYGDIPNSIEDGLEIMNPVTLQWIFVTPLFLKAHDVSLHRFGNVAQLFHNNLHLHYNFIIIVLFLVLPRLIIVEG